MKFGELKFGEMKRNPTDCEECCTVLFACWKLQGFCHWLTEFLLLVWRSRWQA